MVEEENAALDEEPTATEPLTPAFAASRGATERPRRRSYYPQRRRACHFCVEHVHFIDYKDVDTLRRFLSDRARIEPRRRLGTCAKHQRALSQALKRARHLALLPYTVEHIRKTGIFSSRS